MNNPFEYTPSAECDKAYGELLSRIDALMKSDGPQDKAFCRELECGKMLGLLLARDAEGSLHNLYAFSGQIGEYGFRHPLFVEPVFDYLMPGGYFKTKETEISRLNQEISLLEMGRLASVRKEYEKAKDTLDAEVKAFREKCRESKAERARRRECGAVGKQEEEAMIRQSQFEKAELHRLKKRVATSLEPYQNTLRQAEAHLQELKDRRHAESESLQKWLFSSIKLLNARGEERSLSDIFSDTPLRLPPSGTGECCAPKLLQAAYVRGWKPVEMAEYWYGAPKDGEVRIHGNHYPACRGKCLPVLSWMLQGLEVTPSMDRIHVRQPVDNIMLLYENQWFCIVDKPAGVLSVPGKSVQLSVQEWLRQKYGDDRVVKVAHRLDQDTSGLLLAAFGEEAFKVIQKLFATRQVEKSYIADLVGDYVKKGIPAKGRIELSLSSDWLDRPRQRVDPKEGKEAVTDYEFECVTEGRSRVIFHPLTGRTHQLRVHAASAAGLSMPIVGDPLYGVKPAADATRMHLHAMKLAFTFPLDGKRYSFESPVPF